MKIVHISTSDNKGGGARSAYRLHQALQTQGVDSCMYVKNKFTNDESIIKFTPKQSKFNHIQFRIRRRLETGNIGYITVNKSLYIGFSPPTSPFGQAPLAQLPKADIVNLHWVNSFWDFRLLPLLQNNYKAIVWRLSDMNPFTGGCFCDNHCGKFIENCGSCPCLLSSREHDLSRKSLNLKKRIISHIRPGFLHIVAQSRWIEKQIQKSSTFGNLPVTYIPNGIDTNKFKPCDSATQRAKLGIPHSDSIVLFVSQSLDNPLKGGNFFTEALSIVADNYKKPITILAIGEGDLPETNNIKTKKININNDKNLIEAYSLADVFIITSLQENFPNTVLEAMSCGTPVVGFNVGGIPDMVINNETGFLVPVKDTHALAHRIIRILSNDTLRNKFSKNCRQRIIENFSLEKQAKSYINLYKKLLN